jgi:hypothetical protein
LHGNTLGGDRFLFLERQTPKQITNFIKANMGENGNKFFVEDSNSGIYGKIEGSDDWSLIDDNSDDTNKYTAFGYRCQWRSRNSSTYANILYPRNSDFYNFMKTYNITHPNARGTSSPNSGTTMTTFTEGIYQSDFDVIGMFAMNLDITNVI